MIDPALPGGGGVRRRDVREVRQVPGAGVPSSLYLQQNARGLRGGAKDAIVISMLVIIQHHKHNAP